MISFLDHLRIFRLFIEHSQMDLELDGQPKELTDIPIWWPACPNEDVLNLVLRNQVTLDPANAIVPLVDMSITKQAPFKYAHYCPQDPGVLMRMYGLSWDDSGIAELSSETKTHLLHVATIRWHEELAHPSRRLARWKSFARYMLRAGTDPTAELALHTPLTRLLGVGDSPPHYIRHDWDGIKGLQEVLQEWTSILSSLQVDMMRYAEVDLQSWKTLDIAAETRRVAVQTSHPIYDQFIVDSLCISDLPRDWSISVRRVPVLSIWTEARIPGAWPQETKLRPGIVRVSDEVDLRTKGYHEARTVDLFSAPLAIRNLIEYASMDTGSPRSHFAITEDDCRAVALAVLWRRRPTPRVKRSSSLPARAHLQKTMTAKSWQLSRCR